jgi:hypothetical protein
MPTKWFKRSEKEKIFSDITITDKTGTRLQSAKPENGVSAYIWRMIRFHSGKDVAIPKYYYNYLIEQLREDGYAWFMHTGLITEDDKVIFQKLDKIINLFIKKLNLRKLSSEEILLEKQVNHLIWSLTYDRELLKQHGRR